MNTENTESQRMNKVMSEIQALQEVVTRFRQMRLDATEFACLKCIVTFKAGQYPFLTGYYVYRKELFEASLLLQPKSGEGRGIKQKLF